MTLRQSRAVLRKPDSPRPPAAARGGDDPAGQVGDGATGRGNPAMGTRRAEAGGSSAEEANQQGEGVIRTEALHDAESLRETYILKEYVTCSDRPERFRRDRSPGH